MESTLDQRSVVVTGCGQGIGRGIAVALADAGWQVVGVDVVVPAGDGTDAPWSTFLTGDTRDRGVHREAAAAATELAPLRGWVNNAGVTRPTPLHALADPDREAEVEQTVRDVLEINALGYLWGCSAALAAFLAHGLGGAVVNIGSIHGRLSWTDHAAYEVSKGGVDALTRSIAVSYGARGIRANAIAPGRIRTEAIDRWITEADDPGTRQADLDAGPPQGRMGTPAEIGAVAAFLLSDAASYLTGQSIAVDGGWTSQFGTPPPPELG